MSTDRFSKIDLINKYQNMMYKYGEFDAWDDDIEPKIPQMTYKELLDQYEKDKKFYEDREAAGGCW